MGIDFDTQLINHLSAFKFIYMTETKTDIKTDTLDTKPGEMTTVTSVLEKLRVKKHDKEFRMSPEGFTAGNGKTNYFCISFSVRQ